MAAATRRRRQFRQNNTIRRQHVSWRQYCTRFSAIFTTAMMLANFAPGIARADCASTNASGNNSNSTLCDDINSVLNDTIWYDPNASFCDVTGSGTPITPGADDTANAKIIIGIAKTENLGKQGALIGLMVGITESHLRNLGNTNVPISKDAPAIAKDSKGQPIMGSDHDSVGIFQQRPSTGWSTYDDGPGADNNRNAVLQLMDVPYQAEAFFGSPPGSNIIFPLGTKNADALRKGVQNQSNWQTRDPGEVAQAVQGSAFPDRYNQHKAEAQQYIDQFWDAAPPLTPPIPINGSLPPNNFFGPTGSGNIGLSCPSISGAATGSALLDTIVKYAWPVYHRPDYLVMKPEYQAAVNAAIKRGEYVGGGIHPGVDCGGFVTRVFRDSGVDPQYNAHQAGTIVQEQYLREHPEKYKLLTDVNDATGTKNLLPGDIAIINSAYENHTYIFIGPNVFKGYNSASASIDIWRSPMADNAYDFSAYHWYRPLMLK